MNWLRKKMRPKPVRVVISNGIGLELTTLELVPGKEERFIMFSTFNLCDRGFGDKDGKHRLVSKDIEMTVRIKLEGTP